MKSTFKKSGFAPVVNDRSEILILGTMPGLMSIKLQQYYGHAGNQFWKLMFALFNKPLSNSYEERKLLLLNNRIALWDVLDNCDGEGSADSAIVNEIPNDFGSFFTTYPKVKHVFFTSRKAELFYDKHVGRKPGHAYHLLPSPSSANTWKTFDQKLSDWKLIVKIPDDEAGR